MTLAKSIEGCYHNDFSDLFFCNGQVIGTIMLATMCNLHVMLTKREFSME
jgi:hypothetical protein